MLNKKTGAVIIIVFFIVTIYGCGVNKELQYNEDIDAIVYKNEAYSYVSIPPDKVCQFASNRYLGETDNGHSVYDVNGSTAFLCTRTWDGFPSLYALYPENVFKTDIATGVYIQKNYINSAKAANVFLSLLNIQGETYKYTSEVAKTFSIKICYNELPIGTAWLGEISIVNNTWIFTSQNELERRINLNVHSEQKYEEIEVIGIVISDETLLQSIKSYIKF